MLQGTVAPPDLTPRRYASLRHHRRKRRRRDKDEESSESSSGSSDDEASEDQPADHRTLYLLILLAVVLIGCLAFLIWLSKRSYSNSSFSSSSTAASIRSTFTSDCLAAHNDFRATHHADPLEWNETLARSSERWAKNCVWEHSKDLIPGGYGENLYAVASTAYGPESTEPLNASNGIWVWNHEESMYSYGPPPTGFTHETGHFTQTVWRATTTVGCFMQMCRGVIGGGDYGAYLVCQYFPPGNVGSADLSTYIENVQAPGSSS